MPVLASLGIQAKKRSPPQRDQGKKMLLCMCVLPAPFFCAWEAAYRHPQHLTPATMDAIIIVLALHPKADPL